MLIISDQVLLGGTMMTGAEVDGCQCEPRRSAGD